MSTDLINHLPLPICQVYLRARNEKSVSDRRNNTYYLFESAMRTMMSEAFSNAWGAPVGDR